MTEHTRTQGWNPSPLQVKVKVAPLCLTLCDPMDYTVHVILQARILPNPGIRSRSPALQADSLPPELSGKPLESKQDATSTVGTQYRLYVD